MMVNTELKPKVIRFHTCHKCNWFRDLVGEERDQQKVLEVPGYGKVTNLRLAELDVQNHSCAMHITVRTQMRKYTNALQRRRVYNTDRNVADAKTRGIQASAI